MPLKILLAEDDVDERRRLVSFFLSDASLAAYTTKVMEANDGAEAMALFERDTPDLVLTDLEMPGRDGFELVRALRSRPNGDDLPIIAMSATARDGESAKRLRPFSVEVISKPIDTKALGLRVRSMLLDRRRRHPQRANDWRRGAPRTPVSAAPAERASSSASRGGAVASSASASAPSEPLRRVSTGVDEVLVFDRPLRGMLDKHPLARLLVRAAIDGATGTLKLTRGKVRKLVYLQHGRPIFVDSNLRNETLGAYLVQQRVIDEGQLSRAMKHARANNRKLGQSLVELSMTSDAVINAGLQAQTQIKLVSALRWPDGAFSFVPGSDFLSKVPSCPVDPVRLTLTALKRFIRPEQISDTQEKLVHRALVLTSSGQRFRRIIDDVFGPTLLERASVGSALSQVIGRGLDIASAWVQVEALAITDLATFVEPPPAALGDEPIVESAERASARHAGKSAREDDEVPIELAEERAAPPTAEPELPAPPRKRLEPSTASVAAQIPRAPLSEAPRIDAEASASASLPSPASPPLRSTIPTPPPTRTVPPAAQATASAAMFGTPQPPLPSAEYAIPPALPSIGARSPSPEVPVVDSRPSDAAGRASAPMLDLENLDPTVSAAHAPSVELELFDASDESTDEESSGLYGVDSGIVSLPTLDDLELEERDPDALPSLLAGGDILDSSSSSVEAPAAPQAAVATAKQAGAELARAMSPTERRTNDHLTVDPGAEELDEAAFEGAAFEAAASVPASAPASHEEAVATAEPQVAAKIEVAEVAEGDALVDALRQMHQAIHQKSYYELLEVEPNAAPPRIEAAYREVSERFDNDAFSDVELGEDDDKLFEVNLMIEQAHAVLLDPHSRKSYDERLALARAQPTTKPSVARDGFGAELFFQDGRNRLAAQDLDGAVEAFQQAIEHNAAQPDYHAYHGWALYLARGRGEAGAKAARPCFARALEIAPDSLKALDLAATVELEVRNEEQAAKHLAAALKASEPPRLEIFRRLRDVLARRDAFRELEEHYRTMIFRLRSHDPQRTVSLWVELCYLYRDKLGEQNLAKQALEVAAKLAPTDPTVQAARAALAAAAIVPWQDAAEGQRQRVASSPEAPTEALRELVALHRRSGQKDRLFCAVALLVGLEDASTAERTLYDRLRPDGPDARRGASLLPHLDDLRDEQENPLLEDIVSALSPLICQQFPLSLEDLGSSHAARIAPDEAPPLVRSSVGLAARMLEVTVPSLYRSSAVDGIVPLPGDSPALLIGARALDSREGSEVAFAAGRALSCLSPGRRHVFERRASNLKGAFLAALALVRPDLQLPDDESVGTIRQALQSDSAAVDVDELRKRVEALLARGGRINLSEWMRALRRSAARIGLLVGGDPAALRLVAADEATRRDLLLFALSDEFYELRVQLDVARPR